VDNPSWEGMNGMEWKPRKPLSHRLINLTKKSHPPPLVHHDDSRRKKEKCQNVNQKKQFFPSLPFPSSQSV